RAQLGATYSKSGIGVKRILKSVNKFRQAENKFVEHRIDVYSRRLIVYCVKHQAGMLILLNEQNKIEIATAEDVILRNWSYYELMDKIKYKAKKAGIEMIVD